MFEKSLSSEVEINSPKTILILYFPRCTTSPWVDRQELGAWDGQNDGVVGGKRSVQFWALLHNRWSFIVESY